MDRLEPSKHILSPLYPVRAATMARLSTVLNNSAILLLLVAGTSFEIVRTEDSKCAAQKPTTAEGRLRDKFLPFASQAGANNSTEVRLQLVLRKIYFDEKEDKLQIHSWFRVYWKDCRYKWDPSSYDNLTQIHLPSHFLSKPDIADLTAADMAKTLHLVRFGICILRSDGVILCVPSYNHVVTCSANLRYWPYDTHTCAMMISSWTYKDDQMNISIVEPGITLIGYNSNREWQLTSVTSSNQVRKLECCTYKLAVFEFTLQRHSGTYTCTVVIPAVVLMILTLITFWMEPAEADRLVLAALNLVSHILFLQHLGKILPANGDQTPLIITFYRDSMFLATMAFFTSAVAPDLKTSTMDLPLWASCLSNMVLQSRFGRVFFVQGLDETNVGAVSEISGGEGRASYPKPSWTIFTSLIDFICFVVTLVTYTVLLFGYIP